MNALLLLTLIVGAIPDAAPKPATVAAAATAPQIEKLTQDGKADEAMEQGRAAVAAHPDDVDLRLALARALAAKARRSNRVINAKLTKKDIDRGELKLEGVDIDKSVRRIDYDSGLFEEAMLHLEFGIKRAPQREDLRVFQCFLLTDAGHIDRAKAAISSTLDALPKTPALAKTMTAYGAERAKRGDAAGGAALLAPVASAFPKDAAILVDYANVLTRLGRKSEAYAAFDRVTALAPREVRYVRTKAVGAMLLRDYPRARAAFDAAFRLGRDGGDQFASYAAAYGIDPKASAVLMRELGAPAASSDPSVANLANDFARAGTAGAASGEAMTLARKLVASQQFVFAIPVLDRALRARPKNVEAKTMLQTAFRELGAGPLAN
jgi:tetratricopeptide (TPR) repeat protein